ncbi:MAG: hypothetical protein Hals2KO_12110 [Halioglobus sp.]
MATGQHNVWCLLGKKAGDNTQVLALARAVGSEFKEKRIVARPWELLTHLSLGITLAGIDRSASSELAAPWPDLVISAGRRNEPVARWIKQQSGGRTRLVHIGRPWAPLDCYDLIVTTPQYFLPQQDNILHNALSLHEPAASGAGAALQDWREQFASLPRPWIAVLVGGDSGRFVFTAAKGGRLGNMADELARNSGGSLLVTDSPRTPSAAGDALQSALTAPHFCYRVRSGGDNPYKAVLALADAFIVTGESMSMLSEAADTRRPLYIFDPGAGEDRWWLLPHAWRYKPLSFRLAMRFGPARMRRDVGRIQAALVDSGRAHWMQREDSSTAVRAIGAAGLRTAESSDGPGAAQLELARSAEAVRRLLT